MYEEKAGIQSNHQLGNPSRCTADVSERGKPEIARAIDELRNVVDRYDCLVERLADRLECVVSPAPPVCTGEEAPGYITGLASAINETRCKLRNITDNLESIYERIEL